MRLHLDLRLLRLGVHLCVPLELVVLRDPELRERLRVVHRAFDASAVDPKGRENDEAPLEDRPHHSHPGHDNAVEDVKDLK